MDRNRTPTVLFIGILICVPMLALYHFGVFPQAAQWLAERLPRYLVLPADGLHFSLPLQYSLYTLAAFSSAWLGLALPAVWQKYLYLLTLSFLIALLCPLLALNGVLFEPFSSSLATCFAGLMGVMLSDAAFEKASPSGEITPSDIDAKDPNLDAVENSSKEATP